MSKNIPEIPITEIVERCQKLSRSGNNTFEKIRGITQDIYTREIPSKFDWNFMLVSSSFTSIEDYTTGNVSINTGGTTATFSSDTVLTSSFVGRKISFSNSPEVYEITAVSGSTSATIKPSYQSTNNISNGSYVIFQNVYSLASNFDRFPKNGGVYRWEGNKKVVLPEEPYRKYLDYSTYSPVSNPDKIILVGPDTAGNQRLELIPPPSTAINYGYDYFKQLQPLMESTAGTISSIAAKATAVVGNTNTRFLDIYRNHSSNSLWFRIDALGKGADSEWYRVIRITHDSSLTLATAFANTAITSSANYTLCEAPDMPVRLHIGVIYGSLRGLELDQTDENFAFYHAQYAQVMSDAKRIYVSRPYSVDMEGIHEDFMYRY